MSQAVTQKKCKIATVVGIIKEKNVICEGLDDLTIKSGRFPQGTGK